MTKIASPPTEAAPPDGNAAPDETIIEERKPIPQSAKLYGRVWQDELLRAFSFVRRLNVLREERSAHLALLRRNAGETLSSARHLESFYRLRPPAQHIEKYFLVATLFDHNRLRPIGGDFGHTMRAAAPADKGSFERRVLALLDADFNARYDENDKRLYQEGGALSYRLLQMVRRAASQNAGVNWPVLIADLCLWDDAHKAVQKKWARNFFDFRDAELSSFDLLETPTAAPREYSQSAENQTDNGDN